MVSLDALKLSSCRETPVTIAPASGLQVARDGQGFETVSHGFWRCCVTRQPNRVESDHARMLQLRLECI
jgi:hypothetical protein